MKKIILKAKLKNHEEFLTKIKDCLWNSEIEQDAKK